LEDIFREVPLPQRAALLPFHALAHEMLFQQEPAARDYELIWEQRDSLGNDPFVAWSAFKIGKVDEAVNILNKLLHDPHQAGSAYRNLGFLYLHRGDLVRGEKELNRGIDLAINLQEMDELLKVSLPLLERSHEKLLSSPEGEKFLRRIKEKIIMRRGELDIPFPNPQESVEAAQQELLQKVESCTTGDWSWVGVHAGLARLYTESTKLEQAADEYLLLMEQDAQYAARRFLEATVGLSRVATEYARLAWQASQKNDILQTRNHFRRGMILSEKAGIIMSAEDLISDIMSKSAYLPDTDQYELLRKVKLDLDNSSTS
jgi:tetratricopeptide (TPR) repeat protein